MNLLLRTSFFTRSAQAGLLSLLLLLGSFSAQAQTNTWTGGTDTDWNTAGNWSLTLVPDATHDVVIPSGPTNQPILSTTATVKSVAVASSATLTINNTGSLDINGATGFALTNRGTLDNSGTIRIGNLSAVADRGIVHYSGTLYNRPGGLIQIDRTSAAEAFYSTGVVTNEATIRIGTNAAVTGNGFTIEGGTFTNSGTLTIGTNVTGTAILNKSGALFTNLGEGGGCQAQIQGLILSLGNGVISNSSPASFSNTGTIIENSTGTSAITFNGGVVQNNNGGTFNITTNPGLLTTGAVWTGCVSRDWNTPANWSGKIIPTTTDDAIIASAPANQPIISTTATAKSVEVQSGASLSISSVGSLTINGYKFISIYSNSRGNYFLPTAGFGNSGTVVNEGSLVMGNSGFIGFFGFANAGTFSNRESGRISIDGGPLYNASGSFVNVGTISSRAITNEASFSNTTGGYIASAVNTEPGSTFVNSSTLTIGISNSISTQSGLLNVGSFTNTAGGYIAIDRSQIGLNNSKAFPGDEGIFVNSGIITIGASVTGGSYGILNSGTFSNMAGGSVSIERTTRGLLNSRGSFVNSATITLGPTVSGTVIDNSSGATFTNQGCPALLQGLGNAVITNAGSFSNTGTIIENASGNSNISFNGGLIVNNNGGSFTVASGNAAVSAGTGLVWQGCVSSDWNTAGNWYPATVPTATDDAIIQLSAANQPIISTTATAKSVEIQTGASLSISSAGSLSINGSTGNALTNAGNLTNEGNLLIGSVSAVGGVGISMASSGTITNSGTIQIDRTGSHAIQTAGLLNNAAIISIGSLTTVGGQGISNTGTINNNSGGITINRTTTGVGGDGVFNGGTFVNSATLTIGDVAFVGQDGVYNQGIFRNASTGEIRADRAFGNGIWNIDGGTFGNDGKIFIGSVATTGVGILNSGTASFTNNAGASIQLDRVWRGLTNVNTFFNAGQIRMGNNVPLGEAGLLNGNGSGTVPAVFNNLPGGLIQIDQPGQDGITNELQTTFNNAGTVSIGTSGSIGGNAIINAGTVTNQSCAVIRAFAPVYNQNGTFTNNGFLTVNTLWKPTKTVVRVNSPSGIAGTYVFGTAFFGPPITTANLTANAVLVDDGTGTTSDGCSSLINAGQLSGKIALVDRGTCTFKTSVLNAQNAGAIAVIVFNNTAFVGRLGEDATISTPITIPAVILSQPDGAAIKAALTPGPVNISITQEELTPSTTLTNNGVINYPQGNPIPNVTNNDLIVSSFSLCSGASTTALQIGGSNSFSAGTTWYTNPGLTMAGGTYDQGTNTFTPNSLSVGTHTLYFSATDNVNSCSQTVAVSLTVLALPTPTLVASGSLNCSQTSVTLTASGGAGTSYTFANASGTLGTPGSASTLVVSAGGTYSVTVANAAGCIRTTTTTVLSDTALPTLSLMASNSLNCAVTSTTLSASANGVGSLTYTFTGGSLPGSPSTNSTVTVNQPGSYSVLVTAANGCTVSQSTSVVSTTAPPTVTIMPAPSLTIGFQSVTLTASGAGSYSWSSGQSTTAISVSVAGPYTVTGVTGGCAGTATVNVVSLTEVAGITVGAIGLPVDVNGGNVLANDLFIFTFVLTNTGNDPTRFQIPNMAATTGPGVIGGTLPNDQTNTAPANGQLQFSTDNGTNWTNVGAGGTTTPSVSVNGRVQVRVPMTVQPGAQPNDVISLQLGNTPGDAQNVLRSNDGGDVYTVDNADGAVVGEILGSPTNGVREASFTQSLTVVVTPPPSITAQPASASSVCEGASVVVTVGVSGSISGYQWLKGSSPVVGQTSATLSLGNVQVSDSGVYSLSLTGPTGSTTSNGFTLTVNPTPTATITFPNSVTVQAAGAPGTGIPVVRVPSLNPPVTFQASGGVLYERVMILDRINGFEIRQVDANTTGIFPITRLGLFTLTITGAGGCQRIVQWVVQPQ